MPGWHTTSPAASVQGSLPPGALPPFATKRPPSPLDRSGSSMNRIGDREPYRATNVQSRAHARHRVGFGAARRAVREIRLLEMFAYSLSDTST